MYKGLGAFIKRLEKEGELIRVEEPLSTCWEIPAATRIIAKEKGAAIIFEKVKGYKTPVVCNLLGKRSRLALAFGVSEANLSRTFQERRQKLFKPTVVTRAPVQEVVIDKNIDMLKTIPVLVHHKRDVSPYMSCSATIAKDPETGLRSMGLHRVQIKGKDRLGIFLATPPLSHYLTKAERMGKPLQVAIACGLDPITYFTSPQFWPLGQDKFELAGAFAGRPVELVKAKTVDLEVPAYAQFILEGEMILNQRDTEGPFGESTGYYFTYKNPVARITAITHRRHPIYQSLIPWGDEENVLMDFARAEGLAPSLKQTLPQVEILDFSYKGMGQVAWVQIDKKKDDDAIKVINHLLPSSPFLKVVMVVDKDVNIHDNNEVFWALATRVHFDKNVVIKTGMPGSMIDPATAGGERTPDTSLLVTKTTKMGIDATKPLNELDRYEKIDVPEEVKKKMARKMRPYI